MTGRLLAADLIHRRIDETELRKNLLKLTKKGRSLLASIYREWGEIDREIISVMGERDAEALKKLTLKLRNHLGGRTPGGDVDEK